MLTQIFGAIFQAKFLWENPLIEGSEMTPSIYMANLHNTGP